MKTKKTTVTIAVIFGIALAFTACKDGPDNKGDDGKKDTVQREFPITGTFYRTMSGTLTPYTATITIADQTNGSVSLSEQGIVSKFQQTFEAISEKSKTTGSIEQNAYKVLPRGVKINVINSGESFNGFQALNYNTVRCHIDFISSTNTTLIAAYFDEGLMILAGIVQG